eukprot:TRINITY_DN33737_c0_g1_i1.p2 TRINITY_DN33737_c0_g1~~TRINITY_DN33737_c0_g1_i1.p2  ORF type:complete len:194 (-),score=37.66 TRINITY_DN33737_c0_g1_i1:9-590(-)
MVVFAFLAGLIANHVGDTEWSWHEAFYFTAVTMTTVGYGDYALVSSARQKVLAMVLIWLSVTVMAILLGFIGDTGQAAKRAVRRQLKTAVLQRWLDAGVPLGVLFLFAGLHIVGMVTFASVENWGWIDSLYFTTVTLSTVGYGDIVPETAMGRKITALFALMGVPFFATLVSDMSNVFSGSLVRRLREADSVV